jgi:hypothetical protein
MRYFYYVFWIIEVLAGVGLFTISFLLQNEVLQAFMSSAMLALLLAVFLEAAKVAAIVWHRYFVSLDLASYPDSIRMTSFLFRLGLLGLSMLCSVIYLSSHLDRPYIKQIQSEEIGRQESIARQSMEELNKEQEQSRINLQAKQKDELDAKRLSGQQRVLTLERILKDEMDNVVNGVFQGPRYTEINKRLEQAYTQNSQDLAEIKERQFKEQQALNQFLQQQKQALDAKNQQQLAIGREAVLKNDYANDERVNHPMVVAFLNVTKSMFDWRLEPLQFVFTFSILTSVLIELGILLSFDTVTLSIHSLMVKQQAYEIDKEVLKANVQAKKTSEDIKHEADMELIKKSAARATDKAKVYFEQPGLY